MKRWQAVLSIGWALFVSSFFLPVDSEFHMRGWEALIAALGLYPVPDIGGPRTQTTFGTTPLAFASALTNLAILASPLAWWPGKRKITRILLIILALSALVNLYWLVPEDRGDLWIGYYAWWSSFAIVTAGLILRHRQLDAFPGGDK